MRNYEQRQGATRRSSDDLQGCTAVPIPGRLRACHLARDGTITSVLLLAAVLRIDGRPNRYVGCRLDEPTARLEWWPDHEICLDEGRALRARAIRDRLSNSGAPDVAPKRDR